LRELVFLGLGRGELARKVLKLRSKYLCSVFKFAIGLFLRVSSMSKIYMSYKWGGQGMQGK
jgi:hypothetical protein